MSLYDRGAAAAPAKATVWLSLLALLSVLLQTSFFGFHPWFGAVPDLTLILVLLISLFFGERVGGILGLCAGILLSALGSFGVSLLPLFYFLVGYAGGYYGYSSGRGEEFFNYLAFLGIALVARGILTAIYASMTYQTVNLLKLLWRAVLPELLATALMGLLLFLPVRALCRRLNRRAGR